MSDREILEEPYRFGYQGQFSEKDSLTNWNAFQLRMYDARFGRWISPDPYGIGDSPYIGMANNPVSLTDPDGGCPTCPGFVEGLWNSTTMLAEMVVTPSGSFMASALNAGSIISAGINAMYQERSPSLTLDQYQIKYPEFLGMNSAEADAHWNTKYSNQFNKQWNEAIRVEKVIRAQEIVDHWTGALSFAAGGGNVGFVHGPSLKPRRLTVAVTVTKPKLSLNKSVGEVMSGSYRAAGEVSVPIKNEGLLKQLNSTSRGGWVKVYEAGVHNGNKVEIHYFRNSRTSEVFDVKTKYNYWHQSKFKKLQ